MSENKPDDLRTSLKKILATVDVERGGVDRRAPPASGRPDADARRPTIDQLAQRAAQLRSLLEYLAYVVPADLTGEALESAYNLALYEWWRRTQAPPDAAE